MSYQNSFISAAAISERALYVIIFNNDSWDKSTINLKLSPEYYINEVINIKKLYSNDMITITYAKPLLNIHCRNN